MGRCPPDYDPAAGTGHHPTRMISRRRVGPDLTAEGCGEPHPGRRTVAPGRTAWGRTASKARTRWPLTYRFRYPWPTAIYCHPLASAALRPPGRLGLRPAHRRPHATAELVEGDVTSARAAIAGRYLGERDGARFAAERRSRPGVLLRLIPTAHASGICPGSFRPNPPPGILLLPAVPSPCHSQHDTSGTPRSPTDTPPSDLVPTITGARQHEW